MTIKTEAKQRAALASFCSSAGNNAADLVSALPSIVESDLSTLPA
jgi:hypothetical protein